MFVDPLGLDAIVITANNSAGSSGLYAGHISVIVQDENKNWYYFYWGNKTAYCVNVPKDSMKSFSEFNKWVSNNVNSGNLKNSSTNYINATYINGDFSKSKDYYSKLVKNADIGTKSEFAGPNVGYIKKTGNFS